MPSDERRLVAAVLAAVAAAGVLTAVAAAVLLVGVSLDSGDEPAPWAGDDAPWFAAAVVLTLALGASCAAAARALWRRARFDEPDPRALRLFLLAYAVALAWGVAAGGFVTAGLLLYTPFFVAGLAAALLARRLWHRVRARAERP